MPDWPASQSRLADCRACPAQSIDGFQSPLKSCQELLAEPPSDGLSGTLSTPGSVQPAGAIFTHGEPVPSEAASPSPPQPSGRAAPSIPLLPSVPVDPSGPAQALLESGNHPPSGRCAEKGPRENGGVRMIVHRAMESVGEHHAMSVVEPKTLGLSAPPAEGRRPHQRQPRQRARFGDGIGLYRISAGERQ